MAKLEVVECDWCQKQVDGNTRRFLPDPITVYAKVGTQPDAAGGVSEDIKQRVDLCPKHAGYALQAFFTLQSDEKNKAWVKKHKHLADPR